MANPIQGSIKTGVALIYYAVAVASLQLAMTEANASAVWPPAGIAIVALYLLGRDLWPAIWVASMLANVSVFVQNQWDIFPLICFVSSVIATGNVLESLICVLLLESFTKGRIPLFKVRDVFVFVFVTMLACVPAATVGAFTTALTHNQPELIQSIWFTWWLGDVVGILTVGSLIFIFYKGPREKYGYQRIMEAIGTLIVLIVVDIAIFSAKPLIGKFLFPIAYLVLPLVIWSTCRFGYFGATLSVLITLLIGVVGTIGHVESGQINNALILLQCFMGIITVTVLVLAAALFEREQAEEELRIKEERFRKLVEHNFEMLALLDSQAKVSYVSPSTFPTMGYSVGDLMGEPIFKWIHPDDQASIQKKFTEILNRPGAVVHAECRVMHKNNSWRWVESTGQNLLHEKSIGSIVVNYRDITERKQAEEVKMYLASIVENSDESIVAKSLDGTIKSWNRGAQELYGYTAEEMIGRCIDVLVPKDKKDELVHIFEQLGAGKKIESLETTRVRKDGVVIDVLVTISLIKDAAGAVIGASAISRDNTERKRIQRALEESEQRFRTMANTAPVMIWVTGTDTLCTFVNKSWLGFTGHTLEQELGNGWISSVHREDQAKCMDIYLGAFDVRASFSMDYRLRRYDGQYRWVMDTGVPHFDHGEFAGYIGSCVDITELKLAQDLLRMDKRSLQKTVEERTEALTVARKELKQVNRLADIGTLAATVAHELRNPLGVIQLAAYNLKNEKTDLANNRHLANIEKKVWEGNRIIDDLLSYSRIKIPHYEKIALLNMLDEWVATAQNKFPDKAVTIEKVYDHGVDLIEADEHQIREVFFNILNNAFQAFIKPGGKITLSVQRQTDNVAVSVQDTGIGIPKEDINKVFDPFFTRKSKGTGLGLAICNELVALHQGTIAINSEQGSGTTVRVTLPIQRN